MNTLALPALQREPARLPSIAECLVLAALLHLLAVALLGNAPGGTARPGQGVWGALNVRLPGRAEPHPEPPAPPHAAAADTGPPGHASERRWGGQVRSTPTPPQTTTEAGAARLGTWHRTATARDLDPLPEAPAPLPVQPEHALALPPALPERLPSPLALPERLPTPLALPPAAPTVPAVRAAPEVPLHTLPLPASPRPAATEAPLPNAPQRLPALALPAPLVAPSPLPAPRPTQTLRAPAAAALASPTPLNASPAALPPLALPSTLPSVQIPLPPATQTLRAAPAPVLPQSAPLDAETGPLPPLALPAPAPDVAAPAPLATRELQAPASAPVRADEAPLAAGPATVPALPALAPAAEPAALPAVTPTLASTPAAPLSAPSASALQPLAPVDAVPLVQRELPTLASPSLRTLPATPLAGGTPRPAFGNPDAGATLGHDVATAPSAAASAPRLNLLLPRSRGGEISPLGSSGGLFKMLPRPPEQASKLAEDIKKAARPDCRTAYGGMGLLAVVPLAADALRKSGCRW